MDQSTKETGSVREILAANILYLMSVFGMSRRDLSDRLGVPYTTLCDWLKAKTYPRLDTLEYMADYFNIEISSFFSDIRRQDALVSRLEAYARSLDMKTEYSHLYPDGFFNLFGSISDASFTDPEDIPVSEDIEPI